jgi:hypothetical protein
VKVNQTKGGMTMNKTSLIFGIISLVAALVLYLLDLNAYEGVVSGVNVTIYATWFFVLLGGLLILRFFLSHRSA